MVKNLLQILLLLSFPLHLCAQTNGDEVKRQFDGIGLTVEHFDWRSMENDSPKPNFGLDYRSNNLAEQSISFTDSLFSFCPISLEKKSLSLTASDQFDFASPLSVDSTKEQKNSWLFVVEGEISSVMFAPRVNLKQSEYGPVGTFFALTEHYKSGLYSWYLTGFNLDPDTTNARANFVQLVIGKKFQFGEEGTLLNKFIFDVSFGNFMGGASEEYIKLDWDTRLYIPNIKFSYVLNKKQTTSLWVNYFDDKSDTGSALMLRGDWTMKLKGHVFQFVSGYSGGPFGFDATATCGVNYVGKICSLGKFLTLSAKMSSYWNVWKEGDNPFTSNVIGGGIMLGFVRE